MDRFKLVGLIAGFILFCLSGLANANTIDVTYTISGNPGNYILDFTLTNNIPASYAQELYFFGVDVGAPVAGPSGWNYTDHDNWSNASSGGSSINYTSNWITWTTEVNSGDSLSGFQLSVATIPSAIHYFTYGRFGLSYNESDAFRTGFNPGFEGMATGPASTPTPEPATLLLFGTGVAGLACRLRRR